MDSTTYFGAFYNTLTASSDTPQCHAGRQCEARPAAEQHLERYVELRRSRPRRTEADVEPDGDRRDRMGNHASEGDQYRLTPTHTPNVPTATPTIRNAPTGNSRTPRRNWRCSTSSNQRVAVPRARRHRLRHAAGRQPVRPLERSERQQHATQDAAEPRLRSRLRLDAEQHAQVQRDRLLRILQERTGHAGDPGRRAQCKLHVQRAEIGTSRRRTGRRLEVLSRLAIHGRLHLSRRGLYRIHREHRQRRDVQLQPRRQQDSRHLAATN